MEDTTELKLTYGNLKALVESIKTYFQNNIDDIDLSDYVKNTMTVSATEGTSPSVSYNKDTNEMSFVLPKGSKGDKGDKGDTGDTGSNGQNGSDGTSITNIAKTSTNGNVDTYTITFSNNTTTTFTVTNGINGTNGTNGQDGQDGNDGVGITNVSQTTTSTSDGGTNVVTITLSDGTKHTFNVKNGSKGSEGIGWTTGSGTPSSSMSVSPNTLYLNTSDGYVYKCNGGSSWSYLCSLKGSDASINRANAISALGIYGTYSTSVPSSPESSSSTNTSYYLTIAYSSTKKIKICCGFLGTGVSSKSVTFLGDTYAHNPVVVTAIYTSGDCQTQRGSVSSLSTTGFTLSHNSGQTVMWIAMGDVNK